MRIVFNTAFEDVTLAMQRAAESLAEAQRQVSTGLGSAGSVTTVECGHCGRRAFGARSADAYKGAGDAASYRLGLADNVMTDIVNQLTSRRRPPVGQGSEKTQGERDAAANELLAIRDAL